MPDVSEITSLDSSISITENPGASWDLSANFPAPTVAEITSLDSSISITENPGASWDLTVNFPSPPASTTVYDAVGSTGVSIIENDGAPAVTLRGLKSNDSSITITNTGTGDVDLVVAAAPVSVHQVPIGGLKASGQTNIGGQNVALNCGANTVTTNQNSSAVNYFVSDTNGKLKYKGTTTQIFLITVYTCIQPSTNNQIYSIGLYKNNSSNIFSTAVVSASSSSGWYPIGASGVVSLATNDEVYAAYQFFSGSSNLFVNTIQVNAIGVIGE